MSSRNGTAAQRKYVTLVSKEGFEFVVLREATLVSPAIRSMLDPDKNFLEAQTGRCVFHDIRYVPTTNSNGALAMAADSACSVMRLPKYSLRSCRETRPPPAGGGCGFGDGDLHLI